MATRVAQTAEAKLPGQRTLDSANSGGKHAEVRRCLEQLDAALKRDDPKDIGHALDTLCANLETQIVAGKGLPKASLSSSAKAKFQEAINKGAQNGSALVKWVEANPKKAAVIIAGLALGVLPMTIAIAPFVGAAFTAMLTPSLGGAAAIVGVGAGGALASGTRSLYVNAIPMHVLGVDKKNNKQLATDVGMSTGFGFIGFGQAEALAMLVGAVGGPLEVAILLNLMGLVGYEVAKDYFQNAIRNRVANDPKKFGDIAASAIKLEGASNGIRAIPGLGTNYALKVAVDIFSTVAWNRLVNKRNGQNVNLKQQLESWRFDLNMRISELYDNINELQKCPRTPERDEQLKQMNELRNVYMKDLRPRAEALWSEVA